MTILVLEEKKSSHLYQHYKGQSRTLSRVMKYQSQDWRKVVVTAKLFPINCEEPRAGYCQQCHITGV